MEVEVIHGQVIAKANHYQAVPGKFGTKNWAFKLQNMLLTTLINGITKRNPKRWLMRFWDITPTLTRITETTHMMTGLYIVTAEAAIEKVVRQLKRNVPILPT